MKVPWFLESSCGCREVGRESACYVLSIFQTNPKLLSGNIGVRRMKTFFLSFFKKVTKDQSPSLSKNRRTDGRES